jgi:hypothetical protein
MIEPKIPAKSIQEMFCFKRTDEFNRAIDEALTSLGEPVKNTVFQHLQNDFGIEKKAIPSQIDMFSDIMHKIFGLGASRLEIKFMKNLNSKIGIDIQWPEFEYPLSKWILTDMSFREYVHNARKTMVLNAKNRQFFKLGFDVTRLLFMLQ